MLSDAETRSISAENPYGVKGGGARETPKGQGPASMLGQGWKVRPGVSLPPGETVTLADITGPGIIQHIWMTVRETAYRDCILRFYWDGEETPFLGYPLYRKEPGEVPCHGLYRWHILDPIRFKSSLRVTMQALGWWPGGKFQPLTDDIASVAYWYQGEPHAPFPAMPPVHERYSR